MPDQHVAGPAGDRGDRVARKVRLARIPVRRLRLHPLSKVPEQLRNTLEASLIHVGVRQIENALDAEWNGRDGRIRVPVNESSVIVFGMVRMPGGLHIRAVDADPELSRIPYLREDL